MLEFKISLSTLASMVFCATVASSAEPSVWDVAREPRLASDLAVLRDAERALIQSRIHYGPGSRVPAQIALREIESIHAASSPEPRVRYFLGRMLARVEQDDRATVVLQDAFNFAPNHPGATDALFSLAVSLARLGRSDDELVAYRRWLAREWSNTDRAVGLSNLAEGLMAAGHIEEAIASYRDAIAHDYDNALAHWGLAVALDRSGDSNGALLEAGVALLLDPRAMQLDSPAVFFIPAYDQHWYHALGWMAGAVHAAGTSGESFSWRHAVSRWDQYLSEASADDRWLPIARLRREFCAQHVKRLASHVSPRGLSR